MPICSLGSDNGFYVSGYCGDGAVLLAFNLDEDKTEKFAGFAIEAITPDPGPFSSNRYWLRNQLSLKKKLTREKKLNTDKIESKDNPFQTFHWVHFPGAGPGQYTYISYPCYFKGDSIEMGKGLPLDIDLNYHSFSNVEVGFTRGYVSSQAYSHWAKQDIRPKEPSIDFDTGPYQRKYEWLGGHARKMLFEFLSECLEDQSITVDAFIYDFDEPDMIRNMAKMGSRLRVIQDNSRQRIKDQVGSDYLACIAARELKRAGSTVKGGCFCRLAHNKVLIQKKDGKPVKVLTGSANFTIRGLYVQANSILIFNDPVIAGYYEEAFEQAFNDMDNFKRSKIARQWYDATINNNRVCFSFAPHPYKKDEKGQKTTFTLDEVSEAIRNANNSVLFAIMSTTGKGPVLSALKNLGDREDIYSAGTIEEKSQVETFKMGKSHGLASFNYLKKDAPAPFKAELSGLFGRGGKTIHHKFIVCDFNDTDPVVFCGSSNLSLGEAENGDNLIAICDPSIVTYYAIEAIRLYDHYRFRSKHEKSTTEEPLALNNNDRWVERYYDPDDIKYHEREQFCKIPIRD